MYKDIYLHMVSGIRLYYKRPRLGFFFVTDMQKHVRLSGTPSKPNGCGTSLLHTSKCGIDIVVLKCQVTRDFDRKRMGEEDVCFGSGDL